MSNSWHHAVSASRKWGGTPHDYLPIEEFIDGSKSAMGDVRHRALYHHTLGVFLVEQVFGPIITIIKKNGTGTYEVPTREIAEQHIVEDLGRIPSPSDWLDCMNIQPWMGGRVTKFYGREHMLTTTIKEGKK
jgi:hypothetical protein